MVQFFQCGPGFQRVPRSRMNRAFVPECDGHSEFYQPAGLFIQRPNLVALFSQIRKRLVDLRVFALEVLNGFRRSFLHDVPPTENRRTTSLPLRNRIGAKHITLRVCQERADDAI